MRRACFAVALVLAACNSVAPEDASETSTAELRAGTRVCSWNIRRLGQQFDDRPKDIKVTASIIKKNCDLIAVQEVMQSNGEPTGYAELRDALGSRWNGVVTERAKSSGPAASSAERYAFYYRKAAAAPCAGWSGASQLNDERGAFLRAPAWACFSIAGRPRDMVLATYHAVFGSMAERRREVSALDDDLDDDGQADDVLRAIRASHPGNPDIVMVGDFNLGSQDIEVTLPGWNDHTTGAGSTLNLQDEITANLYDHVLIPTDEPLGLDLAPAEVLDVRAQAQGDTFFRSVSDHLPIRFLLKPPADP